MGTPNTRPAHRWFAASYDLLTKLEGKKIEQHRRYVAGLARGHVLEIGCGTGLNFDFYDWSSVDHLDAIEPDPYMLRRARDRLAGLASDIRDRIRLHDVAAESLPFADASFDSVVSMLVLCSVSEPERALAEIRRVLKPHAELRLVEHVSGNGFVASVQKAVQPIWGRFSGACHLTRNTEAGLREAGFRLELDASFKLHPIAPAFRGVAFVEKPAEF